MALTPAFPTPVTQCGRRLRMLPLVEASTRDASSLRFAGQPSGAFLSAVDEGSAFQAGGLSGSGTRAGCCPGATARPLRIGDPTHFGPRTPRFLSSSCSGLRSTRCGVRR